MPSRQINEFSQKGNRKKLSWWPDLPQTSAALLPLSSSQKAMVWMTVGAIRARVEELAAPTSEMNRSSFGMAAAKPTASVDKGTH